MKNRIRTISYALAALLIVGLSSQTYSKDKKISKKDVPETVIKAFNTAFPNVKVLAYLMETKNDTTFFEFKTVEGTTERDIQYDAHGTLVEVEEKLALTTVPPEIAKTITTEMPKAKIVKVEKTINGTDVTYEVKFEIGRKMGTAVLSSDGKIIKKKMKKDEKKEKKEHKD